MKSKKVKFRQWLIMLLIAFSILYSSTDIVLGLLLRHSRPPISCLLQKGTWTYGVCRYKTSDAGEVCRTSMECQSWCVTEEYFSLGSEAEGVCYEWTTPRSCLDFVDYGIMIDYRCFD